MAQGGVKVKGLKPFARRVGNRSKRLQNMAPAYKRAVTLYHAWILRNFAAQGTLHDDPKFYWKELKSATLKRRRKKGAGGKILQDTGSLRRDWELTSSSRQGVVASQRFYSSVHEDGAVVKKKSGGTFKIPQRKIFPEIPQARKIIQPAFDAHLDWNTA